MAKPDRDGRLLVRVIGGTAEAEAPDLFDRGDDEILFGLRGDGGQLSHSYG